MSPSLPFSGYWGSFPGDKSAGGVKLTAHLDPMLKFGISGATLLLPLYAFKEQALANLPSSKTLLKYSVPKAHKLKTQRTRCNDQEAKHVQENERWLLPD